MYIGQQFGNYRLLRLIGEGGFAQVYLGEHIYLKTQAALKIVTTKLDEEEIAHLRREARLMMEMDHPHIVRVLEFGMQGSIPFLVMPYASGGSLRILHPTGSRLQLSQIICYIRQVASALEYIHKRKLIHRDVKPENLLVLSDGSIALSDFGIAVVAHSERSLSQHQGDIGGTGAYMAPEQFQGKPRPASDQYALGIMVYEWLTGAPPFSGFLAQLAYQHVFIPPSPLREQITLSLRIESVILKALAKDPHERFPTVQDFALALEEAATTASEKRPWPKWLLSLSRPAPASPKTDIESQAAPFPQDRYALVKAHSPQRIGGEPFFPTPQVPAWHSSHLNGRVCPPLGAKALPAEPARRPSGLPDPVFKTKRWLRLVSMVCIVGALLTICGTTLRGGIVLLDMGEMAIMNRSSQANETNVLNEKTMPVAAFLSNVMHQNYEQAYTYLGPSLLLVTTVEDFKKQVQYDDRCYGPVVSYEEVSDSTRNQDQDQNLIYRLKRSKYPDPYIVTFLLQKDLGSRAWLISDFGMHGDLGPALPTC